MTTVNEGKVLGLIAARAGSKGVPGKNLLKINGKELVSLAVDVALQVEGIDYVVCSTDGDEISRCALKAGASVPFIRPAHLAQDDTPMLPVMEHAILEMEQIHNCLIRAVVIIDPTAPMRTVGDVQSALNFYNENETDLVVSVHKGHGNPYFNMLEQNNNYFALPKGANLNYGSRQAAPEVWHINTVAWVYSRRAIMDERARIPKKTLIYEFPEDRSVDIDTPDDIRKINFFLQGVDSI